MWKMIYKPIYLRSAHFSLFYMKEQLFDHVNSKWSEAECVLINATVVLYLFVRVITIIKLSTTTLFTISLTPFEDCL